MNKRLNCVTEPLMDADSYASACDRETGEKGILHGIPVSLKESYYLRVRQPVCIEDLTHIHQMEFPILINGQI